MAVVDWTDPCERAAALREAYFALLSGRSEIEVSFSQNGVERRTRYERGGDVGRLYAAWQAAEAECGLFQHAAQPPLNVVVRSTKGW